MYNYIYIYVKLYVTYIYIYIDMKCVYIYIYGTPPRPTFQANLLVFTVFFLTF